MNPITIFVPTLSTVTNRQVYIRVSGGNYDEAAETAEVYLIDEDGLHEFYCDAGVMYTPKELERIIYYPWLSAIEAELDREDLEYRS